MMRRTSSILVALCALTWSLGCAPRGISPLPEPEDAPEDTPVVVEDDTPTTPDVSPVDVPPACPAPRAICNGSCVDTSSDTANCGGCGVRCESGVACNMGRCGDAPPMCAAPRMLCSGSCVDLMTDIANCGSCGRRCAAGQSCRAGACANPPPTCAAPRVMCGPSCVDVLSDTAHCGLCGFACSAGQRCVGGNCTGGTACMLPRVMCGAVCTDPGSDPSNCGFCGMRCAVGQTCSAGRCTTGGACTPPRMMCSGLCIDVSSDPTNCGLCGRRCTTGMSCSGGVCTTGGAMSRAGAVCTRPDPMGGMDPACGDLLCVPGATGGFCTDSCENNASQAVERSQCGGTGSTCLTQGDPPMENSLCVAACTPTARPGTAGSCRTGTVCTGWWYTHAMSRPDATGCFPFCSTNAHCSAGMQCNARRGACGTTGADVTRLPDGSPCNPMITVMVPGSMTPQNVQCRGLCFGISSRDRTQGICGSFLDTAAATACPDDPTNVQPLAPPMADNLAICIFKQCRRNVDCRTPHICRYEEDATGVPDMTGPTFCNFPTTTQRTGVP